VADIIVKHDRTVFVVSLSVTLPSGTLSVLAANMGKI